MSFTSLGSKIISFKANCVSLKSLNFSLFGLWVAHEHMHLHTCFQTICACCHMVCYTCVQLYHSVWVTFTFLVQDAFYPGCQICMPFFLVSSFNFLLMLLTMCKTSNWWFDTPSGILFLHNRVDAYMPVSSYSANGTPSSSNLSKTMQNPYFSMDSVVPFWLTCTSSKYTILSLSKSMT